MANIDITQGYCEKTKCAYDVYTKNFIDENVISNLNDIELGMEGLASGSPKGTYENVSELENANPETGIYLVLENSHIYSWTENESKAIDLGTYLTATLNTDKTLTQEDVPADAKIVGNKFNEINQKIDDNAVPNHIKEITQEDIENWNNNTGPSEGGTGNVSSDIINSIVVVDELPETEIEGVLYLVKEVEEPTIEYVTNPTMEMGSISREGVLEDSTEYCRTADYVYVYGKRSISISNGTNGEKTTRILCYDENKNLIRDWNKLRSGRVFSYGCIHGQQSSGISRRGCALPHRNGVRSPTVLRSNGLYLYPSRRISASMGSRAESEVP